MVGPWKAGGTAQKWQKVLKRGDGTIIDPSGKTVILQVKNKVDGTMAETPNATIINGPAGLVEFLIDAVIAVAGHFEAEIQITGGGYKEDSNTFSWIVQPQVKP